MQVVQQYMGRYTQRIGIQSTRLNMYYCTRIPERSQNYQNGFLMQSTGLGILTLILKENKTPTNKGAGLKEKTKQLRALDTIHVSSKNQKNGKTSQRDLKSFNKSIEYQTKDAQVLFNFFLFIKAIKRRELVAFHSDNQSSSHYRIQNLHVVEDKPLHFDHRNDFTGMGCIHPSSQLKEHLQATLASIKFS
ncbi:hypothetical protein ACS0TY_035075 [Phlomoides rotata]